jgi:hypothetical protein
MDMTIDSFDAFIPGARRRIIGHAGLSLTGLTFAAKDIIDIQGALALAGRVEEAKSVAHRLLELEPSFRIRPLVEFFSRFTRPGLTQTFADGLRLTGIPE